MKNFLFLVLLGIHGTAAVTHSMTYIVTGATGLNGFPEHNEVGLVDGVEFVHYDSNLKKIIPKTDWIEKNVDADYWERETQRNINTQQVYQGSIGILMQRFNQTDGVHTFQWMYGCEWDDELDGDNKEGNVYFQYGYDGEDFISLDLKTETWIAAKQQAVITKQKWDNDKAWIALQKNYLTQICPEWIKKYVNYGRSSLMRKVLPSVSLLQKTSSSPVTCHATGFYPDRADLFWRKDGEELHEDVDKGEILPNHDGTFQMSVDLKVSSIPDEDWKKYDCVFQLSGVKDDIITELGSRKTLPKEGFPVAAVVGGIGGLLVLASCIAAAVICKRNNKGFSRASNSDTSSSSADEPDSKKKISDEKKNMI